MLYRKFLENLDTAMIILVLFEQFSRKICIYFWPLALSASSNMMHFVSTFRLCALKATQAHCYEEV